MTTPAYSSDHATVHLGDCLDVLRTLPDESVHAVITDPPYGLSNTTPKQVTEALAAWIGGDREFLPTARGFMGNAWDGFVPPPAVWDECFRVLKPGGHLLAFAGSRTDDLMGISIRLAGFDIRDGIAWLYGQGMPKGSTDSEGRNPTLKPAFEPVVVARKPFAGPLAANLAEHGTGAFNVWATQIAPPADAGNFAEGRHPANVVLDRSQAASLDDQTGVLKSGELRAGAALPVRDGVYGNYRGGVNRQDYGGDSGGASRFFFVADDDDIPRRHPANVVLDESQAAALDEQSGVLTSHGGGSRTSGGWYGTRKGDDAPIAKGDSGGASRFYYTAKADRSQRIEIDGVAHPTVKPLDLMRWLVRMVTPPGGTVLEPFAGSGTTVEACIREGFHCIGIEREAKYLPLILHRVRKDHPQDLFGGDWDEASA